MNKKELIKNSLKAFFAIALLVSIPQISNAEVKREMLGVEFLNDFILEPAKNEVFLNPGASSMEKLSIINRKDKPVTFQIQVEDIVGSDNPGEQVKLLGEERGPYSLKDFLVPEINEFTLSPGEKITIPVRVQLPADIEPRGYYGAMIVSAKGDESDVDNDKGADGVTKIVTRLGSIFLVRINGEVKEESNIHDFKTIGLKKMFYSKHPEGFEVAVKNSGNVHLVHYGEVKIKNIFGKEISSLPINAFFSLPDSTRYREVKWADSFSFGFYKAEILLYPGFETESGFLKSTLSFFVLPWKLLLLAVLVALIIFGIIKYLKNNFKFERKI